MALFGDQETVWKEESERTRGEKFIHFWALAGRSFVRNRGPVRASALAYTTLLALVPLLAIGMSISASLLKEKGSEPIKRAIDTVVAKVAPQLDLVSKEGNEGGGTQEVAKKISEMIGNIRTGTLNATAIIALVCVAISLLTTIEATFNDIWGVTKGRNWFRRIIQYWAVISLGPVLLALAMGLTTGPYLKATQDFLAFAPFLGSVVFQFLPLIVLTITFALFYKLIPNTPVHWSAAAVGGFVGAYLWQLNSGLNVIYLSQVVRNSKIYGSIGVLPVFLLGLYFSWLILLFGAQVAYAFQNRRVYDQERRAEHISSQAREFVALRIMTLVAERFATGARPPSGAEIAEHLAVPGRLVLKVLNPLLQNRLVVEATGSEPGYIPARPLEKISYQDILQTLRAGEGHQITTRDEPARSLVRTEVEKIEDREREVASKMTLDLVVQKLKLSSLPADPSMQPERKGVVGV